VEKIAIFFSTGKPGKDFPVISGSACSSGTDHEPAQILDNERDTSRHGRRPLGCTVRANRYFDSVLARDMLFAVTGCWRQKGKYRGTVLERRFMVPSIHCAWRVQKSTLGCVGKVRASHLYFVVLSLRTLLTRNSMAGSTARK